MISSFRSSATVLLFAYKLWFTRSLPSHSIPDQPCRSVRMQTQTLPRLSVPSRRFGLLDRYFYFFMSMVTVAVVVYGFSFTVDKNLIHPAVPRPWLLYVHAAVFSGWLAFFILQSVLIRTRNVQWHRRTGWLGLGLGIAVVVVGVATALTMARFNRDQLHAQDAEAFLIVPLFDMVCFATTFGLAIYWRKKPEFHRRLILIATCALTAAGFGRIPESILPRELFYAGVDALILLGVMRDWLVNRQIHRVYRYALPVFMIGQTLVVLTLVRQMSWWQRLAHALVG